MNRHGFSYVVPQAFSSLRINGWMTFAAIATIAISLFLCLLFWLMIINIDSNAEQLESNVEIIGYIADEVPQEKYDSIKGKIASISGVSSLAYISREDGLARIAPRFGTVEQLLDSMGGVNPLPNSFSVKAQSPEVVAGIAEQMAALGGISEVRYGENEVEKLFAFTSAMRLAGIIIMVLLAVAAVFLAAMTTRISVYARKQEIMVMKWVGATNWFIRCPFLLEGIILGLVGALLAVAAAFFVYAKACAYVAASLSFIVMLPAATLWLSVGLITLGVGVLMGAIGSIVSLARFLNV